MSGVRYLTVNIDGVEIFYRESGSADLPTLLLLHGFPTSSHMFRDLIPLLADRFHLIAPDYPGFGYSAQPPIDEFEYTFDHLTDVIEKFVDAMGMTRYVLYMQDFGGPVGFRLATRRPDQVSALIIQNANAYDEGVSSGVRDVVLRIYKERTPQTEARLKELFELPVTKRQYLEGSSDGSQVSPDSWQHAQWGMERPGNKQLQFVLHANYGSNLERYEEWHEYFRRFQPPTLIVWGRGDFVFTPAGAEAYRRDLNNLELHMLDAGHFALETHAAQIAQLIRDSRMLPGSHAGTEPESNRKQVADSFQRWARGTGSPFELLSADADWTIVGSSPLSKTYHGKQAFLDEVIHPFNARMRTPLVPTVRGIYADGDTVIALFDAAAIAADGAAYRNTYTWYFTMRAGMVSKAVAFFDTREFDAFWQRVKPTQ